MAANSMAGGKQVVCGRVSHRHSSVSRHQQPNSRLNPKKPQASRKKGRDGASFGRVLEGLTGQTVHISPFVGRHVLFVCVYGAFIRLDCGSHGNAIAECHCSQRLASGVETSYSPRQSWLCNILAQILRKK
ncbi:hypothetical protein LVW35_01505 [Pseudomonas sp. HN11]|uniref:hypothetical protein n=1 Tax=Pseudomonas sp. HN11 TaxID=1344094 RepID=UPI001F3726D0|nr:hypothetical protein [Pseudomonas sp. HN11]UII71879.1 hypothetical protein LVW35_01505 [Pseudomonas sp. HN11]